MKDPVRLRERERGAVARVLRSSHLDEPPKEALDRTLAALGLGIAAASAATAAQASTTATGATATVASGTTLTLVKWVGIGVFVGTAAVGVVETATPGASGPAARSAPVASASVVSAPPRVGNSETSVPPAQSTEPSRPAPRPVVSPRAKPSSLTADIQRLDEVRRTLREGKADDALRRLEAFDKRGETSTLTQEAQVLRMEAYLLRGELTRVRSLGRAFLTANPSSAYADRVRSLVRAAEERESGSRSKNDTTPDQSASAGP